MLRIDNFEIYADYVGRVAKFYSDVFNLSINKFDGPPDMESMVGTTGTECPGVDGAIV